MIIPVLFARIEDQYDFAAIRINGGQIRTFKQITTRARQSEIPGAVVAVVLFRSNMLDLEAATGAASCGSRQYSQQSLARCRTSRRVPASISALECERERWCCSSEHCTFSATLGKSFLDEGDSSHLDPKSMRLAGACPTSLDLCSYHFGFFPPRQTSGITPDVAPSHDARTHP